MMNHLRGFAYLELLEFILRKNTENSFGMKVTKSTIPKGLKMKTTVFWSL